MKIEQISVAGLFGIFNHVINLKSDSHITIIHGPNGYGKTAILKIINNIFNSNYSKLFSIHFDSCHITFDDKTIFAIEKDISKKDKYEEHSLNIKLLRTSGKPHTHKISAIKNKDDFYNSDILEKMDLKIISDINIKSEFEKIHIYDKYLRDSYFHKSWGLSKFDFEAPKWLKEFQAEIKCKFIETQRLFLYPEKNSSKDSDDSPVMKNTVIEYSKNLAQTIKTTLAEYASLSQNLDSTFPVRLVEKSRQFLNREEIQDKLTKLKDKREKLMSVGLLDKESNPVLPPEAIDETNQSVLSVYVQDIDKKLGSFDQLAKKIDLFIKIINNKFLYKTLSIDKETGFSFKTNNGAILSSDKLSSGEQHELIMLYELLFRVEQDSLILIDEPEISLHIHWQEQFLIDLEEITKLLNFNVIIATHSPAIINNRLDLMVELKGN